MIRILIVDDVPEIRDILVQMLSLSPYEVINVANLQDARARLSTEIFDIILLDVKLPDGNGIEALSWIKQQYPALDVIMMTAEADKEDAIQALSFGAWDYLQKPLARKELLSMLEKLVQYRVYALLPKEPSSIFSAFLGKSPVISSTIRQITQAASGENNLHLHGETGTGKDLAARLAHEGSVQSHHTFVVVDCATLSDILGQSHLFGHIKGAFTGAIADKAGLISQAHKGTLFLDEVGELSLELQKSFLRVLQEKSYMQLGATSRKTSHFRLISATNKNLHRMVEEGTFREDLYYRLRGISIAIPPLRERRGDVRLLAEKRCEQIANRTQQLPKTVSLDCLMALESHHWPGNVRELFSVIDAANHLAGDYPSILCQHIPAALRVGQQKFSPHSPQKMQFNNKTFPESSVEGSQEIATKNTLLLPNPTGNFPSLKHIREHTVQEIEKNYLRELMNLVGNDITEACAISGLSRSRLYLYLQKYSIKRTQWQ